MKKASILKTLATVFMATVMVFGISTFVSADSSKTGGAKNGWAYEEDYLNWDSEDEQSHWFYYENSKRVTGWKQIGTNWYYFANENYDYAVNNYYAKGAMVSDCWAEIGGTTYHFNSNGVNDKTLNSSTSGWMYIHKYSSYVLSNGEVINGAWASGWYYYVNGNPSYGWKSIGGSWYYFNPKNDYASGVMTEAQWRKINGTWYHFNAAGVNDKTGSNLVGWVKIYDNKDMNYWLYFDKAGHNVTGWKQLSGKWYYFNDYGTMATECVIDNCYLDDNGVWFRTPGWHDVSPNPEYYNRYIYIDSAGHAATGWKQIDGKWYYFEKYNGEMVTNQVVDNCYLNSDGSWYRTPGWYIASNNYGGYYKVYIDANGYAATGWKQIDGYWYYFDEYEGYSYSDIVNNGDYFNYEGIWINVPGWYDADSESSWHDFKFINETGKAATGWKQIDGNWYYFNEYNGQMMSDGVADGCYFDRNGVWVRTPGWYDSSTDPQYWHTYYYIESNGYLALGWKKLGNNWFYFSEEGGFMVAGSVADGCYFDSNGVWVSTAGWHDVSPEPQYYHRYIYIESTGRVAAGWKQIDGVWYYFDKYDGVMVTSRVVDNCFINRDGLWIRKPGWYHDTKDANSLYRWVYIDASGHAATGWKQIDGKWYCFAEYDGEMYINQVVDGCYVNRSGEWVRTPGWYDRAPKNSSYHNWIYVNANGKIATGWFQNGGKWYYQSEDGYFASNTIYTIGSQKYYFDKDGVWTKGWFKPTSTLYVYDWNDGGKSIRLETGSWYYTDINAQFGVVNNGWKLIDGHWYYFYENGQMATNVVIDGYNIGPSGTYN